MEIHDIVLVAELLGQLEQKTELESAVFGALFCLFLGLLELSESVKAASLVDVDLLVRFSTLDELIVTLHCFPIKTHLNVIKVSKDDILGTYW